jgi:hypothetical protein
MGFLDKIFGKADEKMVEEEVVMDETVEIADEAAAMPEVNNTCTCTDEKMCDHCAAKNSADMDEDNLD